MTPTRILPLVFTSTRDHHKLACEQALHLGDIVKSNTREETRKPLGFAARSRVLARLSSLAQIGERARRLTINWIERLSTDISVNYT